MYSLAKGNRGAFKLPKLSVDNTWYRPWKVHNESVLLWHIHRTNSFVIFSDDLKNDRARTTFPTGHGIHDVLLSFFFAGCFHLPLQDNVVHLSVVVSRALVAHPAVLCAMAISAGTTTVAGTRAFATAVVPSARHPSTSPTRPYATRNSSATWGWV